jgi:hypothetical protein
MPTEDRIVDLADRTHHLELLDELDVQKAKAERESRTAQKREIDAERKTLRVRQEMKVYALAEEIVDAIKWNTIIHAGLLYRLNGTWCVRTDIARAMGYIITEE